MADANPQPQPAGERGPPAAAAGGGGPPVSLGFVLRCSRKTKVADIDENSFIDCNSEEEDDMMAQIEASAKAGDGRWLHGAAREAQHRRVPRARAATSTPACLDVPCLALGSSTGACGASKRPAPLPPRRRRRGAMGRIVHYKTAEAAAERGAKVFRDLQLEHPFLVGGLCAACWAAALKGAGLLPAVAAIAVVLPPPGRQLLTPRARSSWRALPAFENRSLPCPGCRRIRRLPCRLPCFRRVPASVPATHAHPPACPPAAPAPFSNPCPLPPLPLQYEKNQCSSGIELPQGYFSFDWPQNEHVGEAEPFKENQPSGLPRWSRDMRCVVDPVGGGRCPPALLCSANCREGRHGIRGEWGPQPPALLLLQAATEAQRTHTWGHGRALEMYGGCLVCACLGLPALPLVSRLPWRRI